MARPPPVTPSPAPMAPIIAFDIETGPLPVEGLGPRARRRLDLLVARAARQARLDGAPPEADPSAAEAERRRHAGSLHGVLGWICCATFVRLGRDGEPCAPRSFTAATPESEAGLLAELWATLGRLPRTVRWVSFYGKTFDAEFLATRSIAHGLVPSRPDLLHRHPYVHTPHLDLASVWRRSDMGLADACELLGLASPKTVPGPTGDAEFDGSGVAAAVACGRLADVVAYCERDAVATLHLYRALAPYL